MKMQTPPRYECLDGLGLVELAVPPGMEEDFGPGPNDAAASYWGPILQGMNPAIDSATLLRSLDECMGDPLARDTDAETLWAYAAFIVAWNILEES